MKLLHTSDWHLGKKLFKESRLEEQKYFLEWLTLTIEQNQVDTLVIAGDIFDSPNPPHDAVTLYFNFLEEISKKNIKIIIIGGNHDSGLFLDAPKKILKDRNILVYGQINIIPEENIIYEEDCGIVLLPYFRNFELYQYGNHFQIESNEEFYLESLQHFLESTFEKIKQKKYKLLFSHHLFGIYQASGSEVAIALSGVDSIPLELIKDFDYVGLGHIHRPQLLKKSRPIVNYSGSPIPMRFSETQYKKSVTLIELAEELNHKQIDIPNFRNLLSIEANEENFKVQIDEINQVTPLNHLKNFLEITISTKNPENNIVDQLRSLINNDQNEILNINLMNLEMNNGEDDEFYKKIIHQVPLDEMFNHFYQLKYKESDKVPETLQQEFKKLIEKANNDF